MIFRSWAVSYCFSIFVAAIPCLAQLPPSSKLSAEDFKGMTEEINRFKNLLASANDKCAVEFEIARNYAAGQQYREVIEWLRKVVDSNSGIDPSRDPLFGNLAGTQEFEALKKKAWKATIPVSNSHRITTIPETDLFPENMAFDPVTTTFFIGSTLSDRIVRCRLQGPCQPLVSARQEGVGYVLGLKLHQPSKTLWATNNSGDGASLRHYSPASGALIESYPVRGAHLFNDLAVSSQGDVFVTDTKEGAVYKLSHEDSILRRLAPQHVFTAANGIALSANETKLFVANFGDGITVVDLGSESTTPMPHPAGICLAYIDGLYAQKGSLIAIQNGPMVPRIVRFLLGRDDSEIDGMKVLERRNPLFDGLTTGVLVSGRFYYIANNQIDKIAAGKIKAHVKLDPLHILAIDLEAR